MSLKIPKPVVLLILDGVGLSLEEKGNAVRSAKMPNLKEISQTYPGTALQASGISVGLPWGEMGNSEVGHLNIGSGLVIYQNLPRITLAIQDKSFFANPVWNETVKHAEKNKSAVHLIGLVSNGGVHSHIDHLFALLEMIGEKKFDGEVFIHIFTDGRDASPQSALIFIKMLNEKIKRLKIGKIASVSGRYYAMDRDNNWDRTKKTYECLIFGKGNVAPNAEKAIEKSYGENVFDEFIEPTAIIDKNDRPIGLIKNNDAVIFFNFRPDRTKQLTRCFTKDRRLKNLFLASMTELNPEYPVKTAFPPQYITEPLAKIISDNHRIQLHVAETEKYAHITYFLNGGIEKPFPGENRILIPSPKTANFDQIPEMNAYLITEKLISEIKKQKYDFIAVNFANCDIIGHTGNFKAAIKAMETIDKCVESIAKEVLKVNGALIITADHGNCEEMINLATGKIDTEHSTNPVPFWILTRENKKKAQSTKAKKIITGGILADVAPTILDIMGIQKPKQMAGISLSNIVSDCPL